MKKFTCKNKYYLDPTYKVDMNSITMVFNAIYENEEILRKKFKGILQRRGIFIYVYFLTKKNGTAASELIDSYLLINQLAQ